MRRNDRGMIGGTAEAIMAITIIALLTAMVTELAVSVTHAEQASQAKMSASRVLYRWMGAATHHDCIRQAVADHRQSQHTDRATRQAPLTAGTTRCYSSTLLDSASIDNYEMFDTARYRFGEGRFVDTVGQTATSRTATPIHVECGIRGTVELADCQHSAIANLQGFLVRWQDAHRFDTTPAANCQSEFPPQTERAVQLAWRAGQRPPDTETSWPTPDQIVADGWQTTVGVTRSGATTDPPTRWAAWVWPWPDHPGPTRMLFLGDPANPDVTAVATVTDPRLFGTDSIDRCVVVATYYSGETTDLVCDAHGRRGNATFTWGRNTVAATSPFAECVAHWLRRS